MDGGLVLRPVPSIAVCLLGPIWLSKGNPLLLQKRRDGDGYLYINAQLPGIIRNFTFKCFTY